jgi:hypothetical protein
MYNAKIIPPPLASDRAFLFLFIVYFCPVNECHLHRPDIDVSRPISVPPGLLEPS